MRCRIRKSILSGETSVPSSKSHTIRAIILASLADGKSIIYNPLKSLDALVPIKACEMMGAEIELVEDKIEIYGVAGQLQNPSDKIDVGNSGTSLRILAGTCSLINGRSCLTGDESIRNRPIQPLLDSLNSLGAKCDTLNKNGKPPIIIHGRIIGGETSVSGITSQFTSSLLMCAPLAEKNSIITPINLKEKPYVKMTLQHLNRVGVKIDYEEDLNKFYIRGNQSIKTSDFRIPGDFSSASFLMAAAAVTNSSVTVDGLDTSDVQGDKKIVDILFEMGAKIRINQDKVRVDGSNLHGIELDLNDTPDLFPILAVVGACSKGKTILKNVGHARIKETDRITAMANELTKMGVRLEERKDGLVIYGSTLKGTNVNGYNDHRIVMSLSVAGLVAEGETSIEAAEVVNITFPNFFEKLKKLGGNVDLEV